MEKLLRIVQLLITKEPKEKEKKQKIVETNTKNNEAQECERKGKVKPIHNSVAFPTAEEDCGKSSLDRLSLLVGSVPRSVSAVFFLLSSSAVSLRVLNSPLLFCTAPPTLDQCRFLLRSAFILFHLSMNRSADLVTPPVPHGRLLYREGHTAIYTPNINGVCTVYPSVARTTTYQVFNKVAMSSFQLLGLRPHHQ